MFVNKMEAVAKLYDVDASFEKRRIISGVLVNSLDGHLQEQPEEISPVCR